MTSSHALQVDLGRKLRAVGVPEAVIKPLVMSIVRSVSAEGPESVVKRIKVLKQAVVNRLAGLPISLDWIAHNQHGPKGPWRPVWSWLASQKYRTKVRALNTVMVYAHFVLPKQAGPTPTQERKFLGSVEQPPEKVIARNGSVDVMLKNDQHLRTAAKQLKWVLQLEGWTPPKLEDIPEILVFLGQRLGTSPESVLKAERLVERFLGGEAFFPFLTFPQVQYTLGEVGETWMDAAGMGMADLTPVMYWTGQLSTWDEVQPPSDPVGVVGFSQEPGAKLRAFAAPNMVLQSAMESMKRSLLDALRKLKWDCTHDQMKGVMGVQRWLADGNTVSSIDLSDATNNFPWYIQERLLAFLGLSPEDVRLLALVSRSPYRLSWDKSRQVVWNVGQPLGAGPSFMSFALAHALVALASEISAGVQVKDLGTNFYILGDDIVIRDEKVARAYRGYLAHMDVPVSESKCLTSAVAGEFAGKFITVDKVYHGYKYREVSDYSFMDVLRSLGAQAVNILTPQQRLYAELVWEVPEPYGLGFNPKGRTLTERWVEFLYLKEALQWTELEPHSCRPEEIVNRMVYGFKSGWWRLFPVPRGHQPVWLREEFASQAAREGSQLVRTTGLEPPEKWFSLLVKHRVIAGDWDPMDNLCPRTPVRDAVMDVILGSTRRIPQVKAEGDPRVSPIQGWSRRAARRLLPVLQKARERWNSAQQAYPSGLTPGVTQG